MSKKLTKDEREALDRLLVAVHLFISSAVCAALEADEARGKRTAQEIQESLESEAAEASAAVLAQIDFIRTVME